MDHKPCLISICGPTGVGKTRLAIALARELETEILSADSRQIFREMSIGTAVPSDEELSQVKHHFIQNHSVAEYYNASIFEQEVLAFLDNYFSHRNHIVMVGGSGMYIDAVYHGIDDLPTIKPELRSKWQDIFQERGLNYLQEKVKEIDPEYYNKVDLQNHKRLLKAIEVYEQTGKAYSSFLTHTRKVRPFNILKIGLNTERKELYHRINQRVDDMVEAGLVEEARNLLVYRNTPPLKTVGYKELFQYFEGEISLEEAVQKIKDHSRAYARRQITWFRRDAGIRWFEPDDEQGIFEYVNSELT